MPKMTRDRLTKRTVEGAAPGSCLWDSDVRGFGVRVTPAGTRSFIYRYTYPAPNETNAKARKQSYVVLGGFPALTVEQARDRAKALAAKGADVDHHGERRRALEERATAKTLRDLADYYLNEYAKTRLRPATVRDARGVLFPTRNRPGLVPPATLAKRVDEVTQGDILRLHGDACEAAGLFLANRLLAVLSRMFTLAEGRGWRSRPNPCRGVEKFYEPPRSRNLSEGEVTRLLNACDGYALLREDEKKKNEPLADARDGDRQNAADAVVLLLYTGARLREVLRAEWREFDLDRGIWEKPSAHTKTKRLHRLELGGEALELLRGMRERAPESRFLFPGRGKSPKAPRADLKRPWERIAQAAGLEGVRLHDLRRTTASFMLSDGFSVDIVGRTLGHTTQATTNRYAHLGPSKQREALVAVGKRMARLKGITTKGSVVELPQRSVR